MITAVASQISGALGFPFHPKSINGHIARSEPSRQHPAHGLFYLAELKLHFRASNEQSLFYQY